MTNEECLLAGKCCDCGASMPPWTKEQIEETKDDMGMGKDDDFANPCNSCMKSYVPESEWGRLGLL